MLTIEMLEADHGDCLWIEYGQPASPWRILVDGGTPGTYTRLRARIEALPVGQRRIEVFIVSHIDSDHIGGALQLLENPPEGLCIGDVWFNGFRHLPAPADEQGVTQAEELTSALEQNYEWNKAFDERSVVVPEDGELHPYVLDGGLKLTVLSPGVLQLQRLRPKWEAELAKLRAGQSDEVPPPRPGDELGDQLDVDALAASRFKEDTSTTNGSSIAVLLEYGPRRLLLGADAHPAVLAASLDRLLATSGKPRLVIDALKVSHHGSRANTSKRLLERLASRAYLVSTSGAVFAHPDREGVARLIAHGGPDQTIYFNYRTEFNKVWDSPKLKNRYHYDVRYQSWLQFDV